MLGRIKNLWKKDEWKQGIELKNDNIPKHVAIIMDGNGRWAKERGLPRVAGHRSGLKTVKKIAKAANQVGVQVLTLYAFSTENWKRPKEEVDYLMSLPQEFFPQEIDELINNNIRIRMTGSQENLPEKTLKPIMEAISRTANNTGMILNFAVNYGSRNEIIQGFKRMYADLKAGKLSEDEITEELVDRYLQTCGLPDPDLLIRTSGELRISNFMLWQLAYAELVFVKDFWPDFTEEHFFAAIAEYQQRVRRYGGL
jgi:undecaprenyl diphosphate synthase